MINLILPLCVKKKKKKKRNFPRLNTPLYLLLERKIFLGVLNSPLRFV